jgi:hypothetical protein
VQATASQVDLVSQISGQKMGYDYWSAVVMWVVQLPMDLHVSGSAVVYAYLSSTDQLSGFLSGGGYAMGLVDIDENNNVVKEFITEAPYSIGNNPFTSTPARYSQSVTLDHVFSKGHWIGFVVGLGATTQGFSATVYFGSEDKNSGATLPVVETIQTKTLAPDEGAIAVSANSAIENLQYDKAARTLTFTAEGIEYTSGSCAVAVPKLLMQTPFTVTQGSQPLTPTVTENATYYQVSFTHTRSNNTISVAGSEPDSQTISPSPSQTASPSNSASPSSVLPSKTSSASGTPDASTQEPGWSFVLPVFLAVLVISGVAVWVFRQRTLRRH